MLSYLNSLLFWEVFTIEGIINCKLFEESVSYVSCKPGSQEAAIESILVTFQTTITENRGNIHVNLPAELFTSKGECHEKSCSTEGWGRWFIDSNCWPQPQLRPREMVYRLQLLAATEASGDGL